MSAPPDPHKTLMQPFLVPLDFEPEVVFLIGFDRSGRAHVNVDPRFRAFLASAAHSFSQVFLEIAGKELMQTHPEPSMIQRAPVVTRTRRRS